MDRRVAVMKTLLVLAPHPELADAVRGALDPEKYRLIHRISLEEADPLLVRGVVDVCVLDVELANVQGIWVLEKLRRRLPAVPIIAYTESRDWQWEEEAYLNGVSHVLTKPARPRMLNALIERLWVPRVAGRPPARSVTANISPITTSVEVGGDAEETLSTLRDFSGILTHSLNAEALLRKFLLQLREILGVNRAALFLRQSGSSPDGRSSGEAQSMRSACALGLSSGLLEHFELSFDTGIGGYLHREGRIVRHLIQFTRRDMATIHLVGGEKGGVAACAWCFSQKQNNILMSI